eukprot:1137663-Pelagomonas_calceolata.AAC.5
MNMYAAPGASVTRQTTHIAGSHLWSEGRASKRGFEQVWAILEDLQGAVHNAALRLPCMCCLGVPCVL